MSNIGKSLFNAANDAAKAINPFEGTVNKGDTNDEKLTFHGTKFALDLGSAGNFTLRKIYNSIKFAPGHAFNAVGLKSFTNYLYPGTTSPLTKENLETHNQNNKTDSLYKSAANDNRSPSNHSNVKDEDAAAATKIQALYRGHVGRDVGRDKANNAAFKDVGTDDVGTD